MIGNLLKYEVFFWCHLLIHICVPVGTIDIHWRRRLLKLKNSEDCVTGFANDFFFFFVCTYILYLLLILWLVCVVCKYLDCYSHQTVLERYHNQKENGGKKKTAIFFFVKFYMYRYDTCNTDNFSHIFLQCKTKRKKKLRFPIFFYLSINHMPHRCCFFLHTLIFIFFYLLFFYSSYSLIRWQDKAKKSLKKGGTHQLNIEVTQS